MKKKIFSMAVAALAAAAISVTAMAADDFGFSHSVRVSDRAKYWREFTAETKSSEIMDEIFAGIQCLRLDTGAAASDNLLEQRKKTDEVHVSVSVTYASYPMEVRAFSSHSAHKGGKMIYEEYDQSDAA